MTTSNTSCLEYYIGIMSGTSLDGVDVVLAQISENRTDFNIIAHLYEPYPETLKNDCLQITHHPHQISLIKLYELDAQLAHLYAECVSKLLTVTQKKSSDITAIGCHGQTLYHAPNHKYPFSVQLGRSSELAAKTQINVVNQFREMDIAMQGQGAPLAPAFHEYLFQSDTESRVIVNIGGISNLSYLPSEISQNQEKNQQYCYGYDTGPGCVLINQWIHSCKHLPYDQNGQWAASGKCNLSLLTLLKQHPFFQQKKGPRSTGTETFNLHWLQECLNTCLTSHPFGIDNANIATTLVELSASSIVDNIQQHKNIDRIILSGGGVYNGFLVARIRALLPSRIALSLSSEFNMPPTQMEAACFAWLAHQNIHQIPIQLSKITGASKASILGKLTAI